MLQLGKKCPAVHLVVASDLPDTSRLTLSDISNTATGCTMQLPVEIIGTPTLRVASEQAADIQCKYHRTSSDAQFGSYDADLTFPYAAADLEAMKIQHYSCRHCHRVAFDTSLIKSYRNMPSSGWEELIHLWLCRCEDENEIALRFPTFTPNAREAFVDLRYIFMGRKLRWGEGCELAEGIESIVSTVSNFFLSLDSGYPRRPARCSTNLRHSQTGFS